VSTSTSIRKRSRTKSARSEKRFDKAFPLCPIYLNCYTNIDRSLVNVNYSQFVVFSGIFVQSILHVGIGDPSGRGNPWFQVASSRGSAQTFGRQNAEVAATDFVRRRTLNLIVFLVNESWINKGRLYHTPYHGFAPNFGDECLV
jgi:hypothetical protein